MPPPPYNYPTYHLLCRVWELLPTTTRYLKSIHPDTLEGLSDFTTIANAWGLVKPFSYYPWGRPGSGSSNSLFSPTV